MVYYSFVCLLKLILNHSKPQNQMCDWNQKMFLFCFTKISKQAFLHDSNFWRWGFFTFLVALAHSAPGPGWGSKMAKFCPRSCWMPPYRSIYRQLQAWSIMYTFYQSFLGPKSYQGRWWLRGIQLHPLQCTEYQSYEQNSGGPLPRLRKLRLN